MMHVPTPPSNKALLLRWWPTAVALTWIVVIAALTIVPEMVGGRSVGPFNDLYTSGLTAITGYHPNNFISGDNITQGIPWSAFNWITVHHGQLPLWNRYNALGLPQVFNFLSGSFAPTSLASYFAPLRDASATIEFAKLVIAGSGVFFLGRVLRLSIVPALFAATVFELSGAFTGWLAWPQSGSVAWLAWILGCVILVAENRRGTTAVAALALTVAANAYQGHPETLALDLLCAAGVGLVIVMADVRRASQAARAALTRIARLAVGGVAGLALSAPLLWPGISVLNSGVRHGDVHYGGFALSNLGNVIAAGYFGYPITGSTYFGSANYYETAMWVGVIAVVLALTALFAQFRLRYVVVFGAIASVCIIVLFCHPVASFLSNHAVTNAVQWWHVTFIFTLAVAVLAGIGLDDMIHRWRTNRFLMALVAANVAAGLGVGALWSRHWSSRLTPLQSSIQRRALEWPTIGVAVSVACTLALISVVLVSRAHPRIRPTQRVVVVVALVLFVIESFTLLSATPRLTSSSTKFFVATPAITTLRSTIANERVGLGACVHLTHQPVNLGIRVESNIMYRVSEFAAYDPLTPTSLFDAWYRAAGTRPPGAFVGSVFCPTIATPQEARHFGVHYILMPASAPRPLGFVFVKNIGDERLDAVPGAGIATLEPSLGRPDSPSARVVPVRWTTESSMRIASDTTSDSTLYVHVLAAPGWHVAIDGRATPFRIYDHTMMLVALPSGNHVVTLDYLPASFVKGIVLASFTAVALIAWLVIDELRRRHHRQGLDAGDGVID